MDEIPTNKTVMFVGEYFTLLTTVQINDMNEKLRQEDESDDDMAMRMASVLLAEYYGWDVLEVSNEVGIVE